MTILQALNKSKRYILFGWIIISITSLLLLMGILLSVYSEVTNNEAWPEPIQNIVIIFVGTIYQKTQFLSKVWEFAPTLSLPKIWAADNWKFITVLAFFIIGIVMRDSGLHLRKRINIVKQRAQEKLWEKSLTGENIDRKNIMSIEISTDSKDNWYSRPFGILSLTIIAGYTVNLLTKLTGI